MTTCNPSSEERAEALEQFVLQHRSDALGPLALTLAQSPLAPSAEERTYILRQIEGWQRLRTKVPRWAECAGLLYPVRLSLEQCSSQTTALYKAQLVHTYSHSNLIDLTGGLGVDFAFMAPHFKHATYIERNADLCRLARHNFPLLALPEAEVVEGDGVEWLRAETESRTAGHELQTEGNLFIYLDPFRRDDAGHKTVRIEDCTPNVVELLPTFRTLAATTKSGVLQVMVKLSPMLDITAALRSLTETREVHIVGTAGEVKEVLLLLLFGQEGQQPVRIICHDDLHHFEYLYDTQSPISATPIASSALSTLTPPLFPLLFDPAPVIMKAGCFGALCEYFSLAQLHPNSHLLVSRSDAEGGTAQAGQREISAFPGRTFRVVATTSLSKRPLRDFLAAAAQRQGSKTPRANLATRNFPQSVAELKKRLHLLDGGAEYWFATTLADGSHILIACEKA